MSVSLSSGALTQISTNTIKSYVKCYMYDTSDIYITELPVENASYNQSRDFGVGVLNLTVSNANKLYGVNDVYEITRGYRIVLIEGFNTGVDTDLYPKFKGYVENIEFLNTGGISTIRLDVFDELILSQKNDIDKLYIATPTIVEEETLTPWIESELTVSYVNDAHNIIRINYNPSTKYNVPALLELMNSNYDAAASMISHFFINNSYCAIGVPDVLPNGRPIRGGIGYIPYESITGSLPTYGLTITNANSTFVAECFTVNITPKVVLVRNVTGEYYAGEPLYIAGNIARFITPYNYYQLNNTGLTGFSDQYTNVVVGDRVHDGMCGTFMSSHTNWSESDEVSVKFVNVGQIAKAALNYDYDVSPKKGLIVLKQKINMHETAIKATYSYYENGLFVEDMITDLLTTETTDDHNLVIDGNFRQDLEHWTITNAGTLTTANYTILNNNNCMISTYTNFGGSDRITLTPDIPYALKANRIYTFFTNIIKSNNTSGLINIKFSHEALPHSFIVNGTQVVSFDITPPIDVTSTMSVYITNSKTGMTWILSDIKLEYKLFTTEALSESNLYSTVSIEDGSISNYVLLHNENYSVTPTYTKLINGVTIKSDYIEVVSTTDFSASGLIALDSELIHYTSKTATRFNTITRGSGGTITIDHDAGIRVYQAVEPNRLWYTKYNNIIPKSYNATSSDYDIVNGVNMGSASSFSITSVAGGVFSKFYYREGILITSKVASSVVQVANRDYYFNQIQATGIEVPYLLLDYKKLQTRFDALSEIRKLIAPNYIINACARKISTLVYRTFIKGRYLRQKTVEDYSLGTMTDLSYNYPKTLYNCVKMFGKQASPTPLLLGSKVSALANDGMNFTFIKAVPLLKGAETNDGWIEFTHNISYAKLLEISPTSNINITATTNDTIEFLLPTTQVFPNAVLGLIKSYKSNSLYSNKMICGIVTQNTFNNNLNIKYNSIIANVYNIVYTDPDKPFNSTDTITGTSAIRYLESYETVMKDQLKNYTDSIIYDGILMVSHNSDQTIFTNGETITQTQNGVSVTAIVYIPTLDGNTTQVNYGIQTRLLPNNIDIYSYGNNAALINRNMIRIDGFNNDATVRYARISGDCGKFLWDRRESDGLESQITNNHGIYHFARIRPHSVDPALYLNDSIDEYKANYNLSTQADLPFGCVAFYNGDVLLFSIGYKGQSRSIEGVILDNEMSDYYKSYLIYRQDRDMKGNNVKTYQTSFENKDEADAWVKSHSTGGLWYTYIIEPTPWLTEGHRIWDQLNKSSFSCRFTRGEIAAHGDPNVPNSQKTAKLAPMFATRYIYYTKEFNGLQYKIVNNKVYLRKDEIEARKINLKTTQITIDAQFVLTATNEYIQSQTAPLLSRLRNMYDTGVWSQAAVVSGYQILDYSLFTIDLGEIKSVGYIDIQAGKYYNRSTNGMHLPFDTTFTMTLYYSTEDVPVGQVQNWLTIYDALNDIDMSSGEVKTLTSSDLGERFRARHFKCVVTADSPVDLNKANESDPDTFCAAISGISIYESDILKTERSIIGDIVNVYKDMNVYEELYTQELLDNYATRLLLEFQKNNTKVSTNVIWCPHLEIGQTVKITDTETTTVKNYFIESISSNNGKSTIELAYYT